MMIGIFAVIIITLSIFIIGETILSIRTIHKCPKCGKMARCMVIDEYLCAHCDKERSR
jgi:hypothetical protein